MTPKPKARLPAPSLRSAPRKRPISAIQGGGNREEILTLQSQLAKARTDRDAAQRNLDALQRLQQQGAASPGEVKTAQDQLARAAADLESASAEGEEPLFRSGSR